MGINVGGNIISSNSVREYEYNSVIQNGLLCHLDARIYETIYIMDLLIILQIHLLFLTVLMIMQLYQV